MYRWNTWDHTYPNLWVSLTHSLVLLCYDRCTTSICLFYICWVYTLLYERHTRVPQSASHFNYIFVCGIWYIGTYELHRYAILFIIQWVMPDVFFIYLLHGFNWICRCCVTHSVCGFNLLFISLYAIVS